MSDQVATLQEWAAALQPRLAAEIRALLDTNRAAMSTIGDLRASIAALERELAEARAKAEQWQRGLPVINAVIRALVEEFV